MPRPSIFATAKAVEEAFYSALAHADLTALMAVWADDEDVVCVHPGGQRMVGLHAVRQSFVELLAHGPVQIRTRDRQVFESPTMVVHNLTETLRVATDEGSQVVCVQATNIYIKTVAGWQLLLHHASPGQIDDSADFDVPAGLLH